MRIMLTGLAILALGACNETPSHTLAETVFSGGVIHTGGPDSAEIEMVATARGLVLCAGSETECSVHIGPQTERIDLAGAAMFPGFTDAHVHILGVGMRELTLNLEDVRSVAELQAAVADAARETSDVISGRGWIETHWPEGRFPTAADLDAVAPDTPVVLVRADGHALVANSAALAEAGVTADTPDPEGGEILRDETGAATGMIIDTAMAPFYRFLREPEGEARARAYEIGAQVLAASGWTGAHTMTMRFDDVDILIALADQGRLPLRVHAYANPEDYDAVAARMVLNEGGGRVTARGIKFYMDGALGSRGAALLRPYDDAPASTGLFIARDEDTSGLMRRALEDGVQLAGHAIGDAGNRRLLDWMEAAFEETPPEARAFADPRWRIEHAQVLHPDDIPRFGQMGVIASMQPSHAIGDLHFAPARIGIQRLEGAYAWRSLVESGAVIAGGSDAPVERGEARIEFYAAAVRRDLDGFAGEGWNLDQALDRVTALRLFTQWPAFTVREEARLGRIAPGFIADFSVFDTDLMAAPDLDLRHARPVMTVLDGQVAWRAADSQP
ncbi:amidohydrolase [Alkalicaulis satelles]|uniref:Amidohydrolase n=1 Tax=Alkalicaulis satelles TaxID=2609175 RepID=A0A5M6ZLI8_9PROT|nr:amidohydrolase [Alkalicaulis satelles]KAA5804805.1 amidohydrolase [Alkalicaulis satelles]